MPNPLTILQGVGLGLGGIAQGMAASQAQEDKQRQLAALEAQRAEQERHHREVETLTREGQQTDIGTLFNLLGQPVPTGVNPSLRVNKDVGVQLAKDRLTQSRTDFTRQQELAQGAQIASQLEADPVLGQHPLVKGLATIIRTTGASKENLTALDVALKAAHTDIQEQSGQGFMRGLMEQQGLTPPGGMAPAPAPPLPVSGAPASSGEARWLPVGSSSVPPAAPSPSEIAPGAPQALREATRAIDETAARIAPRVGGATPAPPSEGVLPGGGGGADMVYGALGRAGLNLPRQGVPSAYRPTFTVGDKGKVSATFAVPTDIQDRVASAHYGGRLFHQLEPQEQQGVLKIIQDNAIQLAERQGLAAAGVKQQTPMGAAALIHYAHKDTLQPPPAGMSEQQLQASGDYVPVSPQVSGGIKQLVTVKSMLDKMETIVRKRPDLFPTSADPKLVSMARAKYLGFTHTASPFKGTDSDVDTLESMKIALPAAVKAFGDTANVAVAEREITGEAVGIGAASQASTVARIENIRQMLNGNLETTGVRVRLVSPFAKRTSPAARGGESAPAPPPAAGPAAKPRQRWGRDAQGRPVPLP